MIAESPSATMVIPNGAGQPPACCANGPTSITWTRMTIAAASSASPPASEMPRCIAPEFQASMHSTAVANGITRGRNSST